MKSSKLIRKQEKMYLRRAQERRFELQVMQEASKIKQAQFMMNKAEN